MSRITSRPREEWVHTFTAMEGGFCCRFDSETDPEKWIELFVPNRALPNFIADWIDAQLTADDWKLSEERLCIRRWDVLLDLIRPLMIRPRVLEHAEG